MPEAPDALDGLVGHASARPRRRGAPGRGHGSARTPSSPRRARRPGAARRAGRRCDGRERRPPVPSRPPAARPATPTAPARPRRARPARLPGRRVPERPVAVDGRIGDGPPAATRPLVPTRPARRALGLRPAAADALPVVAADAGAGSDGGTTGFVRLGRVSGRLRRPGLHGLLGSAAAGDEQEQASRQIAPEPSRRPRARPEARGRGRRQHRARSRNQSTLKMLGWRRMRCDTSDLTRLIREFPKYDRMLAGQC